ncbi:PEPxxWA-CTERM sorting domain-containing protein [Sandaracinobacteroides saxicola]|uniref:PEPxxWA-CTERM sorting domain-containing protein n=1 Tax=Sandaracinobacteroides saxicola TaxID=2759707 RepID=A0A7G5IH17_9SPHN|nr:PEPxxWA-CTERM sorting domain-containing protein [Sandaracinobacteroides saxicola]QMW22659.1 PEPxxWA-CTERM sorting domain-containing protein [Sandaracinobacteroides saxicola]
MRVLGLGASLLLLMAAPVSATVIFADNFDGEGAPGANILNYNSFANWTVTTGNVDLVAQVNPYGIGSCPGKCVDLAGTPGPGAITSKPIFFSAGNRVDVSFQLSGNQRTGSVDDFAFNLTFNQPTSGCCLGVDSGPATFDFPAWLNILNQVGPYTESVAGGRPFVTYSAWFIASQSGSFQLSFAGTGTGNANIGPILDNVLVSQVPEPATWAMLIAGFGMVGFALRRRSALAA